MTRTLQIAAGLLLAAFIVRDARAQWNIARLDGAPNRVYTAFGLDPAFVSTIGYARVVPIRGHRVQFSADAAMGTAGLDPSDFRVQVQALTSVVRVGDVRVTGSATFITRGTENTIYRGVNFGSDFTGGVGVYKPGWFAGWEFGFDKAIVTHISHTDWYRQFYPGAKDGWYIDTGGTYHYGFTGGIAVGRVEIAGKFGWQRTEHFNDLAPPMYVSLGTGLMF